VVFRGGRFVLSVMFLCLTQKIRQRRNLHELDEHAVRLSGTQADRR
jgi:hypothetical protein